MNGFFFLVFVCTVFGAVTMIPRAVHHDRLLEDPDDVDYDLLDAERDTQAADDADAARKEHGFS